MTSVIRVRRLLWLSVAYSFPGSTVWKIFET